MSIYEFEYLQDSGNLYNEVDKKQSIKTVRDALNKLDETERQIIILRYFEDMDSKEVLKFLGIKATP